MTTRQMIEYFGNKIAQMDDLVSITSQEVIYWLNVGQNVFFTANLPNLINDFPVTAEPVPNLRSLIVRRQPISANIGPETSLGFAFRRYTLPSDFAYIIASTVLLVNGTTTREVKVRLINTENVYQYLADPFNKPLVWSPLGITSSEGFDLYCAYGATVTNCKIDYIKQPTKITEQSTSELPEFVHEDIVDMAAKSFLQNLTNSLEVKTKIMGN